jgi:hypothetical protein
MKFSRSALQFLFSCAVVGFGASALAHGATFFGQNPHERFPNIWALHVGMFAVCIPALMAGKNLVGSYRYHNYWNVTLRYVSPGFRYNVYAFAVYALINFFACLAQLKFGTPGIFHGQPALVSHGKLIAYLSDTQLQQAQALTMRMYSGHWMAFYLGAAAILKSALNASDKQVEAAEESVLQSRRRQKTLADASLLAAAQSVEIAD